MPSIFMYVSRSSRPPGAISTSFLTSSGRVERELDRERAAVRVADHAPRSFTAALSRKRSSAPSTKSSP